MAARQPTAFNCIIYRWANNQMEVTLRPTRQLFLTDSTISTADCFGLLRIFSVIQ